MQTVLVARYFFWLLLFHLLAVFQMPPWSFVFGLVMWPYHFMRSELEPPHVHSEMVINGITTIQQNWAVGYIPTPPRFVQRGFERLLVEAQAA